MDKVEFGTLSFKNFRRHTEAELDFPNDQLVAITGKNGQGKSSYLMAFLTALYGRTAEGIELSDLVNKRVGKNLEIHLPFTVTNDEGVVTEYEIHRYYQHKKMKNKLVLKRDGKDISEKTATKTYELIENILIPRSVFLNTIYFSQQVKDFFTSLTDAKQKEIFESILQLDEWNRYYKNASDQVKQKGVDIASLEQDVSNIQARIPDKKAEVERLISDHNKRIDEHELKLVDLRVDLQSVLKQISEYKNYDVDKLNAKFDEATERMANATAQMRVLEGKKAEIKAKFDKQRDESIEKIDQKIKTEISDLKEKIQNEALEVKKSFTDKLPELMDLLAKRKVEVAEFEANMKAEQLELGNKYDIAKLQNESDTELAKLENDKVSLKVNLDATKSKHAELKVDILKRRKELENVDELVCYTCGQKIVDEETKKKFKSDVDEKKAILEEKTTLIHEIIAEAKELNQSLTDADHKYNETKTLYEGKLQTLTSEKAKAMLELAESFEKQLDDKRSEVNSTQNQIDNINEDMEKELSVFKNKFAEEKQKIFDKRSAKLDELNKSVEEQFMNEQKEIKEDISKTFEEVESSKQNKDEIQLKLSEARQNETELAEKKALVKSLENQIKEMEDVKFEATDVEDKENEIAELESRVEQLADEIKNENKELKVLKFWKSGFSDKGIPSMLIDEVVPFMNQAIKQELEKIAPGKFIVSFDTVSMTKGGELREKFAVNILNVETGTDHHRLLSGGEKRQIDVCCLRVLRLLSEKLYQKTFNITLLDEVLDSLDSDNAAMFCQHLKALSKGQNITLITHSMLQDAECDKVLNL